MTLDLNVAITMREANICMTESSTCSFKVPQIIYPRTMSNNVVVQNFQNRKETNNYSLAHAVSGTALQQTCYS